MFKRRLATGLASLMALSGVFMGGTTVQAASTAKAKAQVTVPAGKPEQGWPKSIVIGMIPGETQQQMTQDKTWATAMSTYLGIKVSTFYGSSYTAVVEAMKAKKVDIANYGPFSYIIAHEEDGAIPMGTFAPSKSQEDYYSDIVVPANSPIKSLKQLKGKTLLFADPASTSGHLIPEALLMQKLGLTTKDFNGPGYFANVSYSGSHLNSSIAIAHDKADVAAICSTCLTSYEQQGVVHANQFKIIAKSEAIPPSPLAARPGLPKSLVKKIEQFYTKYAKAFPSLGGNWYPVTDADYKMVYRTASSLHLSPQQLLSSS